MISQGCRLLLPTCRKPVKHLPSSPSCANAVQAIMAEHSRKKGLDVELAASGQIAPSAPSGPRVVHLHAVQHVLMCSSWSHLMQASRNIIGRLWGGGSRKPPQRTTISMAL